MKHTHFEEHVFIVICYLFANIIEICEKQPCKENILLDM